METLTNKLIRIMRNTKVIAIVVAILLGIITLGIVRSSRAQYVEVEPLMTRLGSEYKALHEIIKSDERLATSANGADSSLYQKNEGWLLRNQTIYCANRITDEIEKISQDTGINQYAGNPDGTRRLMDSETFKNHLISLDELCVNEGEFNGERVLEATLFINPEHKIWQKRR